MSGSGNAQTGESTAGNVESTRCEQRYKIFSDYKEAFGENFDTMNFLNYKTGEIDIPGSSLRDAQTGCELYEIMGWDSAEHNSTGPYRCGCQQFDEQLQFVSEEKTDPQSRQKKRDPLSNLDYRLTLEDGRKVTGRTDNDGKIKRIKSANSPIAIVKAEFFVPDDIPRCPGKPCASGKSEEAAKTIAIEGIETNEKNVGSSVQTVTVKVKSRPLTTGEVEMARLIFKDSIDYSAVRVHNEEYLPFGLQDSRTGMVPNGSMYFGPKIYSRDYSAEIDDIKIWFMHEMTHIWQYQLGYSVTWHGFWGFVTGGYIGDRAYKFDPTDNPASPDRNKTFSDFNMEQQGDIVKQYYGAKFLTDGRYFYQLKFYQRVLNEFLRNPKNAALLPR